MKDIPGYEGRYAVTEDGQVWSYPKSWEHDGVLFSRHEGAWLKLVTAHNGYLCVTLHVDGHQKTVNVHRLVALTYLPNPQCLPAINHIDGDKTNNAITNLEWISVAENNRHAVRTGLMTFDGVRGQKNYKTHFSNGDVCAIRKRRQGGELIQNLAEEYGVHKTCIWKIVKRHSWRHLPC